LAGVTIGANPDPSQIQFQSMYSMSCFDLARGHSSVPIHKMLGVEQNFLQIWEKSLFFINQPIRSGVTA
jgi:hypothetical protein